jgi:hypothetical protein
MSIFGGLAQGLGKGLAANQELMREQEAKQETDRRAAAKQLRQDTLLDLRRSGAIKFIADPRIEALVRSQTVTPEQGVTMQVQQTTAANKPSERKSLKSADGTYRYVDDGSPVFEGVTPRDNGTNITVNTGGNQMPGLSKLGEGMTYLYDDDGSVKRDERGAPISAPIQGSKAANLAEKLVTANKVKAENETQKATIAKRAILEIKKTLNASGAFNLPEVGIVGARLADAGLNQEAVDVKRKLETLQSIVSFDRLQQMRDASPTGGALGAVSERELALLQSSMGALSNDMSQDDLIKTLDFLDGIMTKFEAYPDGGAGFSDANETVTAPEGMTQDLWQEMTPEERALWN